MDNTGKNINYFANFSINYRLFDGGRLYNTLRQVTVKKEVNELQYEKIKREVLLQSSLTNDKYNSRITTFSLNQKVFKIAETNYNLATDKQNRGTINSYVKRY